MMPHTSAAAAKRAAIVSIGIKWALVLLVILNLLQLNLLYFSSSGSTRCILKAALATRARVSEAAAPSVAPVLPGSPLGSSEQLGKPVATRLQRTRSGRYALFVIYAWNYEVLLTVVRSYVAAGFGKNLIILDNTSNSMLLGDPVIAELAAEVIPTRTRLTFSQAQNFMADVAIERGYLYYFWGHSDAAVLARDESALFADDVIACVESSFKSRPKWGIIYFAYDWFSAIRTDLVRQVKYDTFVTVYMSDCDFYPRVRAAGFETLNYPEMCPSTKVEVYDLNQPLDIPWKDFHRAKAILDSHRDSGGNRHDWKRDAMAAGEQVGWELWERSSFLYLLTKWGPRQEGESPCKIEVEEPITGNMTLPQQPFGNLAYLQRFWVQEDPHFDMVPILSGLGRREGSSPKKAAAAPKPAVGESAGAPSGGGLNILQAGDDVEVVTESDHKAEQIQAAQLGEAASQLRASGASQDEAAASDQPSVTYLEDGVAASENAEDLYPGEPRAGVWDSLDQEMDNEAEEPDPQPGEEFSDDMDPSQARAAQGSSAAETQSDRRRGASRLGKADAELELDAEPEEETGDDELQQSEDVDSPGRDEAYSKGYYSGSLSREQADDEYEDDEYTDQPGDAEYADQAEDAEYADQAEDDASEQDYTDLPEGSEAEEELPGSSAGAEDVDTGRATDEGIAAVRVKPGAQDGSEDVEAAEGEGGELPARREAAGSASGGLQEAAGDKDGVAADEDAGKAIGAAQIDVGPMDEEGLEDEFSDPADLGLDELDLGDELDGDLQDPESEEEGGGEEDLPESGPLEGGSADQ